MKRNEMPTNTKAYRGETLDDALAAARGELGEGVKVVSADRLRTGGVGGFFSKEIGVEVVVEVPGALQPTQPRANSNSATAVAATIERMVAERADSNTLATSGARDWAKAAADRVAAREIKQEPDALTRTSQSVRDELRRAVEEEREARETEIRARDTQIRVERERRESAIEERDSERRKLAEVLQERDAYLQSAEDFRKSAISEMSQLIAEREDAERTAIAARAAVARAENERIISVRSAESLREDVRAILENDRAAGSGQVVLERLGVPSEILASVAHGVSLAKAVPVGNRVGDPLPDEQMIVLVGPAGVVRRRQDELAIKLGVRPGDLAFATIIERRDKGSEPVRVLRDEEEIRTWVDGRLGSRGHVSILAVEYNAGPGWSSFIRRARKVAARASWRAVVPGGYSVNATSALWNAIGGATCVIDVVDARRCSQPGAMLTFAPFLATIDGQEHSGALWASSLWDIACEA
jgi:flagellar biosynthesis GTPase FlhF